jgi:transcription elongation GreA/GreB family factor
MLDKHALVQALVEELHAELDTMARLAKDAADAATHEENKPENDKDMRSTEASYLARGQAGRVSELSAAAAQLQAMELRAFAPDEAVGLSALVELEANRRRTLYFVVPAGGGRACTLGGLRVLTTTPSSPLGEAIVGLCAGEDAEMQTPQGLREVRVVRVG